MKNENDTYVEETIEREKRLLATKSAEEQALIPIEALTLARIKRLYTNGVSLKECAEKFGVELWQLTDIAILDKWDIERKKVEAFTADDAVEKFVKKIKETVSDKLITQLDASDNINKLVKALTDGAMSSIDDKEALIETLKEAKGAISALRTLSETLAMNASTMNELTRMRDIPLPYSKPADERKEIAQTIGAQQSSSPLISLNLNVKPAVSVEKPVYDHLVH